MECADKAARSHRTPAMGDTRAFAGNWAPDSTRAAATALSLGCNTFIRYGCIYSVWMHRWIQSGGGQVPQSEPCRSVGYREFRSGLQAIGCRRTPKPSVVPVPDRQQSGIRKEPCYL